jgi:putative ABC transport system ATP-binding protein
MTESVILAKALNFWFGEGELKKQILFDIDLAISRGEILLLTGPSGSGKTTLLTLIGALRKLSDGYLQVLGSRLDSANAEVMNTVRRQIGFIFQQHNLLEYLTARQNVELVFQLHPDVSRSKAKERTEHILERVGLGERMDYYPGRLSGGQKQRVAIARALVCEPPLVLADEPTAALDSHSGREVVDILQSLARENGTSILLVTHDNRILDIADRIVNLEDGHIAATNNR